MALHGTKNASRNRRKCVKCFKKAGSLSNAIMQEAVTISTTNAMRHFCDSTVCRRKAETMVVSDIKLPYALRVVKVILPKQMAK